MLLLEAGGKDNYHWIHIPVGYLYLMGNPRADWGFKTAAEPGLNGRSLAYPRGRVLGGCSSINGMIYMRGQARDYDLWRQMGNPGWAWEDVLPYFKKHQDQWALAPEAFDDLHARGGEWRIELARIRWEILDAFRDAAAEAGIPKVEDFNRGDNEGCGYFHVNQKTGIRWNTSKGFLRPVLHRRNLAVETHAMVERLVLDGKRVTGLVMRQHGQQRTVEATREVILAAGAIGSPQILQLSGIGPGAVLQPLGIGVAHDLRGVGENLQDHLQIRCAYKVSGVKTMNERYQSLAQRAGFAAQYVLTRRGPMTMAPSQLGAFVKSDAARETPNLQYHIQPLTLPKFGEPLDPFPAFTASVANIRPTSRGSVRIMSPNPAAHPEIRPNYLSTAEDRHVAAEAIRVTRNIVSMPALARYRPRGVQAWPGVPERGGAGQGGRRHLHHHLPSRRHRQDGQRRDGSGRSPPARARPRWPQGRRRLRHAHHHLRQHQRTDPDDRREGGGDGAGGCAGLTASHPSSRKPTLQRRLSGTLPRVAQGPG